MYISKLILNRENEIVNKAIRTCQNMHSLVMYGFDNAVTTTARKELGVLYRIDNKESFTETCENKKQDSTVTLYVQSKAKPEWGKINNIFSSKLVVISYETKELSKIVESFKIDTTYNFNIKVHPYKKVGKKRVTLIDDIDKIGWLCRKASQNGFEIEDILDMKPESSLGIKKDLSIGFISTTFTGIIKVTDPEKFKKAYIEGIGPEKAYGLGMLLIF